MVGGCLRFVDEIRIKDVELVACQAQVGKIAINGMLAPASRIYTYIAGSTWPEYTNHVQWTICHVHDCFI